MAAPTKNIANSGRSPVFVCRRSGLFSKTYELGCGSESLGTIDFRKPTQGDIQFKGRMYEAARVAPGSWSLAAGHFAIASARRFEDKPLSFEVAFDGRTWLIQESTQALLRYDISERGSAIGHVQAKVGIVSNRLEVHAPQGDDSPIFVFCAWLVGIHWVGIVGVAYRALARY